MGAALGPVIGGGLGLLGGAMANQQEGGKDTGNVYNNPGMISNSQSAYQNAMTGMTPGAYTDPNSQIQGATNQIQNNGILGQLFGQGGAMSQASNEASNLASRGYSLQPEDYEAYGQGAGNIARAFGQNDQSLAQSLSDRGLSSSGVAGGAFAGSLGNKQEQLGQLQTQIANQRMNMNMNRLNQTRNFMGQMGQLGNQAIGGQAERGMQGEQLRNSELMNQAGLAGNYLGNYQNQQNEGLEQQQQTAHHSTPYNIMAGMAGGGGAGASAMGALGNYNKSMT